MMVEVFGEQIGKHARSAVGMQALPSNSAVEVTFTPKHGSWAQPDRGLLLQVRPLGPAPYRRGLKVRTQATHHGRYR
jgi:hypothetical protein